MARRSNRHFSVRRHTRLARLENLEQRRLLAGDVCFPIPPSDIASDSDTTSTQPVYGPVQLSPVASAQSDSGGTESGGTDEGIAVPIVSIFPASNNEGDSFGPGDSPSTVNTVSFTVQLSEAAGPEPIEVDVATSDVTAKGIVVERIATGFNRSLFATAPPSDFDRLFILEQRSGIKIINLNTNTVNPTPFLTIPDLNQVNNEGGLLGLAFHPDFANNGRFFVNMTKLPEPGEQPSAAGDTEIREYVVSANPDIAEPQIVRTLLTLDQPYINHNGGWLDFGPDGYLYIALGDGGSGNDPQNRAQNTNVLFGKMLRIDVDGADAFPGDPDKNYAIPASNPFVDAPGADEIWSYGLRNPYRSSFDRVTGDLYIADVGQRNWEEIDFQPADSIGGENYGWRLREGLVETPTGNPPVGGSAPGAIDPIYVYPRGTGPLEGRSVTGGYVYRGPIADLEGQYFFGDYVNNRVWGLRHTGGDPSTFDGSNYDAFTDWTDFLVPDFGSIGSVSSFGEDAAGNLYIVDFDGDIFAIRNGADYVPTQANQKVVFEEDQQSVTLEIPIVYDKLKELNETFQVTLSNPVGAMIDIDNGVATGTITNDDGVPSVIDVVIDDGTDQRSMIRSLTVTFDGVVDTPVSAFTLTNTSSNTEVTSLIVSRKLVGLQTVATITFDPGPSVGLGNSLVDGDYRLDINGSQITGIGAGAAMAADYVLGNNTADGFYRLYGDQNGDEITNFVDFNFGFLPSFAKSEGDEGFDASLDFNGDGSVNFVDFNFGFLPNFGKSR